MTSIYAFRGSGHLSMGGTAVWGRADGSHAVGPGRRPRRREPGRASGPPGKVQLSMSSALVPRGARSFTELQGPPEVRMEGLTCTPMGIFPNVP